MKKIISVLLTFAVMFALYSCDETRYFKSANWYVSTQVFKDDYIPKYDTSNDRITVTIEENK